MPLPESPIKVHGRDSCKQLTVYSHPEPELYFSKILVLDHGWPQRILPELLLKLADACKEAGLTSYSPDNAEKVAAVLAKLSFNGGPTHVDPPAKPRSKRNKPETQPNVQS